MKRRDFWIGFAGGVAAVVGATQIAGRLRRGGRSRILRLEKTVQIASPVAKVFDAWSDLETLALMSNLITSVRSFGNRSRWNLNINGVPVEWEAEITQIVPYQAIGWKSVTGPKHSGRINFAHLGNDTLVHVQMNYAPPLRFLRRLLSPFSGDLEGYIERVLRDFKAGLERRASTADEKRRSQDEAARLTGTYGPGPELLTDKQNTRFGAPSTPVEYTRPPEAKS